MTDQTTRDDALLAAREAAAAAQKATLIVAVVVGLIAAAIGVLFVIAWAVEATVEWHWGVRAGIVVAIVWVAAFVACFAEAR